MLVNQDPSLLQSSCPHIRDKLDPFRCLANTNMKYRQTHTQRASQTDTTLGYKTKVVNWHSDTVIY